MIRIKRDQKRDQRSGTWSLRMPGLHTKSVEFYGARNFSSVLKYGPLGPDSVEPNAGSKIIRSTASYNYDYCPNGTQGQTSRTIRRWVVGSMLFVPMLWATRFCRFRFPCAAECGWHGWDRYSQGQTCSNIAAERQSPIPGRTKLARRGSRDNQEFPSGLLVASRPFFSKWVPSIGNGDDCATLFQPFFCEWWEHRMPRPWWQRCFDGLHLGWGIASSQLLLLRVTDWLVNSQHLWLRWKEDIDVNDRFCAQCLNWFSVIDSVRMKWEPKKQWCLTCCVWLAKAQNSHLHHCLQVNAKATAGELVIFSKFNLLHFVWFLLTAPEAWVMMHGKMGNALNSLLHEPAFFMTKTKPSLKAFIVNDLCEAWKTNAIFPLMVADGRRKSFFTPLHTIVAWLNSCSIISTNSLAKCQETVKWRGMNCMRFVKEKHGNPIWRDLWCAIKF